MNVLLLGPFPPPHGGVQTNLTAIRRFVREQGGHCMVVNLTRHRRPDADDVRFPSSAWETLKLVLRLPADVIHLHIGGDVTTRLLALALVCCMRAPGRVVLTLHSGGYPDSPAGRTAARYTLRGIIFRRLARIVVVNEQLAALLVGPFGVSREKVRLIAPHALPAAPAPTLIPKPIKAFFDTHRPVLLSAGWLEEEYDYPLQIRALERIRESFPKAGLAILGEGRLEAELRAQLRESPARADVLLAGDIGHTEALAAIANCDIFLRTTLYDGDAISVREALHFGIPVIATDNGMRPPGVELIPIGDLHALVEAARRIASQQRGERTAVGRDDSNIRAIWSLYQELSPP